MKLKLFWVCWYMKELYVLRIWVVIMIDVYIYIILIVLIGYILDIIIIVISEINS